MYYEINQIGKRRDNMTVIPVEQTVLRSLRKYKDLSQEDMARLINVKSRETYAEKEKGNSQFKASEMYMIANFFGMEITEIFLPPNFMNHEVDKEGVN